MIKVVFMGTPDFSVPVLRRLIEDGYDVVGVVTQPDRPVGRKKVMTPTPVKVEAEKHGIPVLQPLKIREQDEYEKVLALEPDLIVTAAFGQIIPKEILEAPKYGCINVHASLLPELRGGAPIHYAIMQGKEKTGITIMYMVEKLDAGDILTQVEVEIEERETTGSLFDKLSEAGAHLLSKTVPLLVQGKLEPIKQDEEKVTFAYNIKREQEKINWAKTGEEVYNHIRGLNPWPVAYTTLAGQVVKVWWGEKVPTANDAQPGTIVEIQEDGFIVVTGNETGIKITELQPAGKKRMSSSQFLRGAKLEIGMKLGEDA
ncbi:methionyl-tRNA formyltransferase [Bacillus cytotoxicus]|uniref:Methionyl-tRNA formyltransferase n=2 Tax=Bacillus cytotoxicus TaxID=580165 RepID=FMT_BACCN|nr:MULTISPECIES: methionyl-tRNA formyltransferase [Bacillus cereus group]A7GRJ6.1 RecName: Full=Methionyl-tRNA formyltransferase [Bacillus cytotoxicus NVH 391-98]ABS22754.1 methionyl-tRNA formyltransferase [Bacillus cytotoxicus NVH 391-98]AWC29419.1 methionyl-tRNA formyltransferase [Bacillus cytotoxicus]AWC33430.1 methionyl-tRNA formyltransferase [Bacillus cytotoxicus]AWC37410.1 methionyl-tRNA formyltransferase [Bacillus cytotoxicus]AWC41548.1 methionyl-tRNA formyltransferase [Bacillus cytoto